MIYKVVINNERTIHISPGRFACLVWKDPLWFLGVAHTIFLGVAVGLAAAKVEMPVWAYATMIALSTVIHHLQPFLRAHPPPTLSE